MSDEMDASNEAYHAWWEQHSPTDHTHHVVHGTRQSIEALQKKLAEMERLRAALWRIEDLARRAQDRDAMHAFSRLATIESKARAALRGGGK